MVGKYREGNDARFWNHAPYYQFAVWARQLTIACASLVLLDQRIAQAAVAIAVLLASLAYHWRVQPFVFAYQNRLEAALHVQAVFFLGLGCFYRLLIDLSKQGSAKATDVLLIVVLFSPGVLLLDWFRRSYVALHVETAKRF